MIPVRTKLTLCDGVTADLLVTPHMSVFEDEFGIQSSVNESSSTISVMERYADLMFLAAVNAWVLDGHGTPEDFPHKRGDFHALMSADSNAFGKAVLFMACALSGKTKKELAEKDDNEKKDVKKKTWIYRLTHRSRSSSSVDVVKPK